MENVTCPLCRGRDFQTLADTDRYDMGIVTVGCLDCGLVMTNPQPTEGELGDFYEHYYRRYYQKTDTPSVDYIREYRKDERAAYTAAFMQRQGVLHERMRVLDIGASEGCVLKAVRDLVPSAVLVAVEPNPLFGSFAVSHAGCTLHPCLDGLRAAGENAFDLIVINHVYEHVKEPVVFLRQLAGLLAPGGGIYIDVPDVSEYTGLESLHVAHLYHFGATTLRRAACLAGYAVRILEKHRPVMHPRSLRCLLHAGDMDTAAGRLAAREGWAEVMLAQRRAARYHRKRWSLWRRLRHVVQGGRPKTARWTVKA
ncbi:MAG: class I SAM-dependent methyltransferase [Burkholderiaceae bacterium]|nr:class I SAM-dependent methyltransferase [Burkholderiaceae bacterium]